MEVVYLIITKYTFNYFILKFYINVFFKYIFLITFVGVLSCLLYFNKATLITYHIYLYYLTLFCSISFALYRYKYKIFIYTYFSAIVVIFWTSCFFLLDFLLLMLISQYMQIFVNFLMYTLVV